MVLFLPDFLKNMSDNVLRLRLCVMKAIDTYPALRTVVIGVINK